MFAVHLVTSRYGFYKHILQPLVCLFIPLQNSNESDRLTKSLTRSLSNYRSSSKEGKCCHCEEAEKCDSEDSSKLLNRLVHRLQKQMDYMEQSLADKFETYITCGGELWFLDKYNIPRSGQMSPWKMSQTAKTTIFLQSCTILLSS